MAISQRSTRNRRPIIPAQQCQPQLVLWDVVPVSDKHLNIVFDAPMQASGLPAFRNTQGTPPDLVVANVSPTVVSLTTAGYIFNSTGQIQLPAYDPNLRTPSGGYAAPGRVNYVIDDGSLQAQAAEKDAASPEKTTKKR